MTSTAEKWEPPNDPGVFESLCLDLWSAIWNDPNAQKNGRSGESQHGVDIVGRDDGHWIGIQCKQKSTLLGSVLTCKEVLSEARLALGFEPRLSTLIIATTGPRTARVQKCARALSVQHQTQGLFEVYVWSWDDIWHELYGRADLFYRIAPIYWPRDWHLRTTTPVSEGRLRDTDNATKEKVPRSGVSRLPNTTKTLVGRRKELKLLNDAWSHVDTRVLSVKAWGGAGKTSLVASWMATRDFNREPESPRVFDWSFHSQGSREHVSGTSDAFIEAALHFFGALRSDGSAWQKGEELARLVGMQPTLLVLDGLEPLQHPPGPMHGRLNDPAIVALLRGLCQNNTGLCVVTTREPVSDMHQFEGFIEVDLHRLSPSAGVQLLRMHGVQGTLDDLRSLVRDVSGHALSIDLLARYLVLAFDGDVRRRDTIDLRKADARVQGGHAFKIMAAYEDLFAKPTEAVALAILRILGLFDQPADAASLAALRQPPCIAGLTEPICDVEEEDWAYAVAQLGSCGLVSRVDGSISPRTFRSTLDTHPLVREYFNRRLYDSNREVWQQAHLRLYRHLVSTTLEPAAPTLQDLQPLYQAVMHGCRAGIHSLALSEVYDARIVRGPEHYTWHQLGAYGAELAALRCFLSGTSLSGYELASNDRAWLQTETGFCLRAVGRLDDAVAPMRKGFDGYLAGKQWKDASIAAANVAEAELCRGNIAEAIGMAGTGVVLVDRIALWRWQVNQRTVLADALLQSGDVGRAETVFVEAESIRALNEPAHPTLSSVEGFRYCEFLLRDLEEEAIRVHLRARSTAVIFEATVSGRAVSQRALAALEYDSLQNRLLAKALDWLVLGRSLLYTEIVSGGSLLNVRDHLDEAVSRLRGAGHDWLLPLGLISRAWLRSLSEGAQYQGDLAEAWTISARSGMRLHMADCLLLRARVERNKRVLGEARALVRSCRYGRRYAQLADTERTARGW